MQGLAFQNIVATLLLCCTAFSNSILYAKSNCMACHQGETMLTTDNDSANSVITKPAKQKKSADGIK